MFKRHPHTPIHAFFDDTPYFLTGAIYKKRPLLASSRCSKRKASKAHSGKLPSLWLATRSLGYFK
ncbi:hypothetical protein THIOM_002169 [Candidatus Thiomargarita nelsonii]|uniref:Uncharacterized protein n=1 Tax=Candidatus Thiomargarita nelsonii TaxID=1003181 RepID=A0A176S278_9GAMM|nr:hypothetical protein THIOM_002169 [Candidatus Thiomargarita nelsonii]